MSSEFDLTKMTTVAGTILAPHAINVECILITIGISKWNKVKIEIIEKFDNFVSFVRFNIVRCLLCSKIRKKN